MTQQEWLDAFKSQNGREPSLDEFKQAKQNGFALSQPAQSVSPQDELKNWVAQFEKQYNRKPSFGEVKQRRFLGDAKPVQPTQPVQAQQPTQATQPVQPQQPVQPRRQQSAQQAAPATPHRNQKKSGKGKKWGIRSLIIIIVLLGAGYFFGQNYYSYDSSMDRAATMLNSHSLDKYSKNVVWADNEKKLTGSEAAPLADLMKSSKYNSKSDVKDLLKSNAYGVQLKKSGKKFLIFDDYKVVVRPVTVKVYTDQSGLTVKANGKVLDNDSDSDSVITVKHQAPGLYEFTASGTSDGDSYKGTDSEQLGDSSTARVYIYTNKSSSSDSSSSSSKNQMTKDDATDTLQSMASLLSSIGASSDSDSSSSTTASDVFTDGSDNKAYTDFTEMIKNNKTTSKRTADSINFGSIDVQDVKSTGKKTADATFKMQEDFNYTSDTDPDKHTSGTLTQVFLLKAHMKYDKDAGKWLVDSIDSNQQKISEQDNTK